MADCSAPTSGAQSTSLQDMYGCITEFACRHRMLDVIQEVCTHVRGSVSSLPVPHVRLASACLYKMVATNNVQEFPTALVLLDQLFQTVGHFENYTLVRNCAKLQCGLKVKILFHYLQNSSPEECLYMLRKYMPRGGDDWDQKLAEHVPLVARELKQAVCDFRKCFLSLIAHEHKLESFMQNQYGSLYGDHFSYCLTRRAENFLNEVEKYLPDTFIDELLKSKDTPELETPSSDVLLEMMLEYVEGKETLQSSDLISLVRDLSPEAPSIAHDAQHCALHNSVVSSAEGSSNTTVSSTKDTSDVADSSETLPHSASVSDGSAPVDLSCNKEETVETNVKYQNVYVPTPSSSLERSDDDVPLLVPMSEQRETISRSDSNKSSHSSHRSRLRPRVRLRTRESTRQLDINLGIKRATDAKLVESFMRSCRRDAQDIHCVRPCFVKLRFQKNILVKNLTDVHYRFFT